VTSSPRRLGDALDDRVSLLDLVDCALNRGVFVAGDLVISVADVDLVYIRLQAVVTSFATALERGIVPGHREERVA
jgi:hypothetical protein